jgi:hypothetical protein
MLLAFYLAEHYQLRNLRSALLMIVIVSGASTGWPLLPRPSRSAPLPKSKKMGLGTMLIVGLVWFGNLYLLVLAAILQLPFLGLLLLMATTVITAVLGRSLLHRSKLPVPLPKAKQIGLGTMLIVGFVWFGFLYLLVTGKVDNILSSTVSTSIFLFFWLMLIWARWRRVYGAP